MRISLFDLPIVTQHACVKWSVEGTIQWRTGWTADSLIFCQLTLHLGSVCLLVGFLTYYTIWVRLNRIIIRTKLQIKVKFRLCQFAVSIVSGLEQVNGHVSMWNVLPLAVSATLLLEENTFILNATCCRSYFGEKVLKFSLWFPFSPTLPHSTHSTFLAFVRSQVQYFSCVSCRVTRVLLKRSIAGLSIKIAFINSIYE